MLVVGAKGFAKEVLEILHQNNDLENLVFYDDVNDDVHGLLYNKFPVLKTMDDAIAYLKTADERFCIGIGNPRLREKLNRQFINAGGRPESVISEKAEIGSYAVKIGAGCIIMGGVRISNDVSIGEGSMIYYNSVVTHDVKVGDFVEISPSVNILGRAKIGSYSHIATGAIIFPDINVGNYVVVGAGSVVTKDLPDHCTAVGIPAKVI